VVQRVGRAALRQAPVERVHGERVRRPVTLAGAVVAVLEMERRPMAVPVADRTILRRQSVVLRVVRRAVAVVVHRHPMARVVLAVLAVP